MKKKFVSLAVIMAMLASLFPVIGIAIGEDAAVGSSSANNIQVAEGGEHLVVLKSDGTVWTVEGSSTSKQVIGLTDVCAVSAGTNHSLALKNDGTVWAWGANNYGQLGNGTTINSSVPVKVLDLVNVLEIAAFDDNSTALTEDGTVYVWGNMADEPTSKPIAMFSLADSPGFKNKNFNKPDIEEDSSITMYKPNSISPNTLLLDIEDDTTECLVQGIIDLSAKYEKTEISSDVQTGATIEFTRVSDGKVIKAVSGVNRKRAGFTAKLYPGVWDVKVSKRGYLNYNIKNYQVTPGMCKFFGAPQGGTATSAKPIVMKCGNTNGTGMVIALSDSGVVSSATRTTNPTIRLKGDVNDDFLVSNLDLRHVKQYYANRQDRTTYAEFSQDWSGN